MTLQALQYRPGVSRESTDYSNSGSWYVCDKVRFRSGMPERIGGWTPLVASIFYGACRNIVEWESLSNFLLLGLGTNLKYYINSNQTYYDITPIKTSFAAGTTSFETIYGALSADISATDTDIPVVSGTPFSKAFPVVVSIGAENIYVQNVNGNKLLGCTRGYNNTTAAAHNSASIVRSRAIILYAASNSSSVGDFVDISGSTAFGGYAAADLTGSFLIVAQSANYVAIDTGMFATSYLTGQGGAALVSKFEVDTGPEYATQGTGWGASIWNSMVYNAGLSTLASTITSTATSITLVDASSFPASGYVMIESEIVQYAGKSTNTLTGCTRGATSSTATDHMAGTKVNELAYAYSAPSPSNKFRAWNTPATSGVNIPLQLWSADTFGQDLVFNIRSGAVFYWVASTGLNADGSIDERGVNIVDLVIDGNPSDAWAPTVASRVIVTDERHVVALGTNDWAIASTSQDPLLIRWCEQEDPLIWEPTQTNTAGFQRLTYGSKIITAEKTRQEILVWTDTALYSMRYLGPPYTFGFNTISAEITVVSPNAVTTANNVTYWMGIDKFYVYSGTVDTLPCALRQYVFDDINESQLDQVYSGSNEKYNEIWWFYCSAGSTQINRYVIYNYLEKLWYYGQLPRTAWYDSHVRGYPIGTMNQRTELEITGVDNGAITSVSIRRAGQYLIPPVSPISTITTSGFGSGAQFSVLYNSSGVAQTVTILGGGSGYTLGDVLTVLGGSADSLALLHEYGLDDAITNPPSAIANFIESADFDIGDGDSFTYVKRIIPDVDFIGSTNSAPSVNITISARDYPGQGLFRTANSAVESGSKVSLQVYNYTNQNWIRLRGRQIAFRIGSTDTGVKWQLGTFRLDTQQDGRR